MTEAVCRDIFGPSATWRAEWRGYTPSERQEFVDLCAGFGILLDGPFDPDSPFPPDLVAAPGSVCWTYAARELPNLRGPSQGDALATTPPGPEGVVAGRPTLPRAWLDWLLSLPGRLLDALRRLLDLLRGLLPAGASLLWLALAGLAVLLLLRRREAPRRG